MLNVAANRLRSELRSRLDELNVQLEQIRSERISGSQNEALSPVVNLYYSDVNNCPKNEQFKHVQICSGVPLTDRKSNYVVEYPTDGCTR